MRRAIESARDALALLVGATPRQVVFTSSIAESVNTGARRARCTRAVACSVAPVERASVLEAAARYGTLALLDVDADGRVEPEAPPRRARRRTGDARVPRSSPTTRRARSRRSPP